MLSSRFVNDTTETDFNERLAGSGFRFTPQRRHVYSVLMDRRDHPTAEEVFIRSKNGMPDISIATVYNCLDALVKCGLVRHVHHDRGATRYCPNMREHGHFYCDDCGGVFDIDLLAPMKSPAFEVPQDFQLRNLELTFRGLCAECARKINPL